MKTLSYIVLLVLLSNCSSSVSIAKKQDAVSVFDYLKSNGITNPNVLVVKEYEEYKKLGRAGVLVIPEVTFFEGNGDLIEYKNAQKECSQDAYFFIKNYYKGKQLKYNKATRLDAFISSYVSLKDNSSLDISDKSKIYVFINWAIFATKLNKDSFKLLSLNNTDFTYVLIDLDVQKEWKMSNQHPAK